MATPEENPDRARLRDHFISAPTDPTRWDDLWKDSYAPWDRAQPSPALSDLLAAHTLSAPQLAPKASLPHQSIARPRALVPGCGKGYDVRLLAAWGYDALGVEYSATAVELARRTLSSGDENGVYVVEDEKVVAGKAEVVQGDFFDDAWWDGRGFDLIYDYTVGLTAI